MLIGLVLAMLAGPVGCKPQQPDTSTLNANQDYGAWIDQVTPLLCQRMHGCYARLFRTLPRAVQAEIKTDRCVATVMQDRDLKLQRHTPAMRQLARLCYTAILESRCEVIAQTAFFHPACMQLNLLADEAYADTPAPAVQMPWDSPGH